MAGDYGTRYLIVNQFVNYCRNLNVRTNERELEHYEKSGIMLPVARVLYPDEYIILSTEQARGSTDDSPQPEWPELGLLFDKPRVVLESYYDLTDDELLHPFDREMGRNPYLVRPTLETYKPWSDYSVSVTYPGGQRLNRPTAEHYYSHWQVHQLYYIQQYPDLYKNRTLLDRIPEEAKRTIFRPWAPSNEKLSNFDGKAQNLNALSFWRTVYDRERKRTFALVAERDGVRSLSDPEAEAYRKSLLILAASALTRSSLTVDDLYKFLGDIVRLYSDYRRDERYKLSDDLKHDALELAQLIVVITGETWEEVADKLGKFSFWTKQDFRHMNVLIKERDEARDVLIRAAGQYRDSLKKLGASNCTYAFPNSEADDLLDYCEKQGLALLLTALSGMMATEAEYADKFRRVTLYTNLKNLLTCLEYFLKDIAAQGNITLTRHTLVGVIQTVMSNESGWISLFGTKLDLVRANNSSQFLTNLTTLRSDPALVQSENTFWVKVFLTTCLARNGTVHGYPSEDWYYGDLFGEMLDAVMYSLLYSWRMAKRNGWI